MTMNQGVDAPSSVITSYSIHYTKLYEGLAYAEKARITGRTTHYLDAAAYLDRSLAMQRNYEALLGLAGVSLALHRFPEALAYAQRNNFV